MSWAVSGQNEESPSSYLGEHPELQNFSYSISYYEEDEAEARTYYNVRITPQQPNGPTVTFTSGNPGGISGYYKGIFNDSLTTLSNDLKLSTVTTLEAPEGSVWTKVDRANLFQVISFTPDMTRERLLSYLAEALNVNNTVRSSQVYTIYARDRNWTPGQQSLLELVSYASS
jgi:hypothetical protein